MNRDNESWSRRKFLKATSLAGMGSIFAVSSSVAYGYKKMTQSNLPNGMVPTRPFGKTGVHVSMLGLGGSLNLVSRQSVLRYALKTGVTYWDTAESYSGGQSEEGIGKYLSKYPGDRKKIFLVTKCDVNRPGSMTDSLRKSLNRMKTSYFDLYFLHSISSASELNEKVRGWVERAKGEGKIRFFGFSTHRNMEECMIEGAKLGWIDGIMMTYNHRLMHTDHMKEAVNACVNAGIGLTAMKTQGGWSWKSIWKDSDAARTMIQRFREKGFTEEQAKLKAVWENPHIGSICSHMPSVKILMSNVAAALDTVKLSLEDMRLLDRYASETAPGYCAGCANICESAVDAKVPIGDIMRYLMYARSYGDPGLARSLFNGLPLDTRRLVTETDYTRAEGRCPQRMPIGRLMREAIVGLS